jgi:Skp family chaperone for outer membrane proteins
MQKKIVLLSIVAILLFTLAFIPSKALGDEVTFDEAVASFNSSKALLDTALTSFKQKEEEVRSLGKEVLNLVKEKKANGSDLSIVEPYLKELKTAKQIIDKKTTFLKARSEFAKEKFAELRSLLANIKSKKENGASKEDLAPLLDKAKILKKEIRNVAPPEPAVASKNSSAILSKAQNLESNGHKTAAIELLVNASKRFENDTKLTNDRINSLNKIIDILNKVKVLLG